MLTFVRCVVTEVNRKITSIIWARPLAARPRRALSSASGGIGNSDTDVDSSGGPYWFHPSPTEPVEPDAPNSWGYWSTTQFPLWAPPEERGEDTIPTLTDTEEFTRKPPLIRNGIGIGGVITEHSKNECVSIHVPKAWVADLNRFYSYVYGMQIFDERIIL